MVTLPDSDDFDCVTCTCIADVDWDGSNEIILGTYGQVNSSSTAKSIACRGGAGLVTCNVGQNLGILAVVDCLPRRLLLVSQVFVRFSALSFK